MVSHQIYFKDTSGFGSIHVPHLYEHAFLNSVSDAYRNTPYVSFSNATTQYRGGILINTICFNEQYAQQLAGFVQRNAAPTEEQIGQALREVEVEEMGTSRVISKTRLQQQQLNALVGRPWLPVQDLPLTQLATMPAFPYALRFRADESKFKQLKIMLTLENQSPEDSALFAHLSSGLLSEVLLHKSPRTVCRSASRSATC